MFKPGKKTWIIGGVVAALVGTTAFAMQMRGHSPEQRAEWATERVSKKLDLNESQKVAFSKVTDSYVEIRGTTPELMLQLASQLKELAADETLTEAEVNELRTQIKAEFDRRADILVPEFVNFYNTLDDNQREQVVSRLEKMTDRIERRAERQK